MVVLRRSRLWLVALATAAVVTSQFVLSVTAWAGPGPAGPPGNNGTIKIDRVPFDDLPNNEPHVGCRFQVDFYGYDQGDLNAQVIFEAQPPTLRAGSASQVLLTDTVFIGEDDNSGGGSVAGLDASATYTLDLSGITPHPQQGVHVMLTIHAEGSQGADVKHKVFWVRQCSPQETTTTSSTTTTSPTTTTMASTTPTTSGVTTTTGALGVSPTSSGTGGASGTGTLPMTGVQAALATTIALALLGAGLTLTIAARRRSSGSH
jgi:hypothetical protein